LTAFLDTPYQHPAGNTWKIGNFRWGAYAFFDYDGEPIYVGQTNERVRTRIGRHLTNQRTDAVAMSVLDPFEVFTIKVWPLTEYQEVTKNGPKKFQFKDAKAHLNALERRIYEASVQNSVFGAILNEKNPPITDMQIEVPPVCEGQIVSEEVRKLRSHPDFRISRRSLIIARLAQVVAERQVQPGLRRVMLIQAKRLEWLARRRYEALGGAAIVPSKAADEEETDGNDDRDER
jgi:hypothetical protein